MRHYVVDPEHVMLANRMIGMTGSPFWACSATQPFVLRYASPYTRGSFKLPERRSELAKLRAGIAEMSRIVSVR